MIQVSIPGRGKTLQLNYLALDMNGTLTIDGTLPAGVEERINQLKNKLKIYLLTADTFGSAVEVSNQLDIELFKVSGDSGTQDKVDFIRNLPSENTVAIGNGFNDWMMLEEAALSIIIIGPEGCSTRTLTRADIAVTSINDALDILINPLRLVATLRE
ncbi:MAG: HAD family hydrolase [Syntrophomonadaceae bacterium]|jgi:P-type E1-E2 ATPase